MSRHLITLNSAGAKVRATEYVNKAPLGTRVEFKAAKRTLPQNDRLWAMLTDIARQREHCGRKYTPDQWKMIFMQAAGQEMQFAPTLFGDSFMPLGFRSSELSVEQMSNLIEFMQAWGAENGITFNDGVAA